MSDRPNPSPIQVLLVEDNPADVGLMRRVFERAGRAAWQLVQVDRLEDAIATCQEYTEMTGGNCHFDVILLDLNLPDSRGLETVTQFRVAIPDIPLVVLTGLNDEELAFQALAAGAQDYLVKDETTIRRLAQAIRYAIERNRHLKQLQTNEQLSRQTLDEEQRLKRSASDYISMIAYGSRTALTKIQVVADFLHHWDETLSQEKKGFYLEHMQATSNQIRYLLNDILMLGNLNAGWLHCEPVPLDLEEFCRNLVHTFELTVSNQCSIVFAAQGNCTEVRMDEDLLSCILTNLLSYGLRYLERGKTLQFTLHCTAETAVFHIQDDGSSGSETVSIDYSDLRCSLEFAQGTSFGLYLERQCVDLHQGKLQIEVSQQHGIQMTVTLPIHSDRSA